MSEIASRSQIRMSFLRWALVIVPLVVLLGLASAVLAQSGYGNPWFDALAKPPSMPPAWLFPVAWTILYVLIGLALAMLLNARGAARRGRLIGLFVLQLVLNYAWSPLFFRFHQIAPALALIAAMVVLTGVLMALLAKVRPLASLLLAPYFAWLLFAGMLTFQILTLNPEPQEVASLAASPDMPA